MAGTRQPSRSKSGASAAQLSFQFDAPMDAVAASRRRGGSNEESASAREQPMQIALSCADPATPAAKRRKPARSMAPQNYPGCLGKRPPAPLSGEQPLNTKRAAHFLGKRVKWIETVRHLENSPPWIKTGGGFEYFESQLIWWRALLSEGAGDSN